MTDAVKIYHNPRCSKSRDTLSLLKSNGVEPEVVETPFPDRIPAISAELDRRVQAEPVEAEPFAAKYFETVDWVWANKTYHMADALLNGLYPGYADPATLVKLGDAWLDEHIAADNALKRLIVENVASSHRTLKVREYNEAL